MPAKNVAKTFALNAYSYLYNRGWNLGSIFIDKGDYGSKDWLQGLCLEPSGKAPGFWCRHSGVRRSAVRQN